MMRCSHHSPDAANRVLNFQPCLVKLPFIDIQESAVEVRKTGIVAQSTQGMSSHSAWGCRFLTLSLAASFSVHWHMLSSSADCERFSLLQNHVKPFSFRFRWQHTQSRHLSKQLRGSPMKSLCMKRYGGCVAHCTSSVGRFSLTLRSVFRRGWSASMIPWLMTYIIMHTLMASSQNTDQHTEQFARASAATTASDRHSVPQCLLKPIHCRHASAWSTSYFKMLCMIYYRAATTQ